MRIFILTWMPRLLLLGGLAWIIKVGAIIASDGENTSEGIVAVLFFLGVVGMALGATALGAHLTRSRSSLVAGIAILLSIPLFFVSFVVIDELAKATIGDVGPAYMRDEHGIWLTGLLWAIVASWLLRVDAPTTPTAVAPAAPLA